MAAAGLLFATATGCGPKATLSVQQEGLTPPLDHFTLESKWAFFNTGEDDCYLLSFPLPGAVSGDRHFYLYLVCTPGIGDKVMRSTLVGEPHGAVGFFIQQRSMNAGLTELVDGRVKIKAVPLRGDRRTLDIVLSCHDGSSLVGEATVMEAPLELREFKEKTHLADVQRLMERARRQSESAPAAE